MPRCILPSPVGLLTVTATANAVVSLCFGGEREMPPETALLREAACQLDAYFHGERRAFTLPLAPRGTAFQQAVWQALCAIPCGETRSYGEIAAAIGKPRACRAVGMANHRNPIPIFIPCHRVVGKDGALTGYVGGLAVKRTLLEMEQGR